MFLWRRRRGLAWAAIVGGGGVLLGRYALTRFMEWQASASEERALKEGLKRQFLTNQADCVDTVVRFLDHLRQQLDATVSVDAVTEEIKTRGASLSREEKIALWERVKVLSFARLALASYSMSLLTLLVRTQVSLVGRVAYRDLRTHRDTNADVTIPSPPTETPQITEITDDTDIASLTGITNDAIPSSLSSSDASAFLSLAWHLLHRGIPLLSSDAIAAATDATAHVALTDKLTPSALSALARDTCARLHARVTQSRLVEALLPAESADAERETLEAALGIGADGARAALEGEALKSLVAELRDWSESPHFAAALTGVAGEAAAVAEKGLAGDGEGEVKARALASALAGVAKMADDMVSPQVAVVRRGPSESGGKVRGMIDLDRLMQMY